MKKRYLIPAVSLLALFFSSCSIFDGSVEKKVQTDKKEDRYAFLKDKNSPKTETVKDTEKDEVV